MVHCLFLLQNRPNMIKIELLIPLAYFRTLCTSSTETTKITNFVFFLFSFANHRVSAEEVAHASRNVTNLLPFSTPEGSRCRLIPVLSGLQESNYVMLQYKQVMTHAQPPGVSVARIAAILFTKNYFKQFPNCHITLCVTKNV